MKVMIKKGKKGISPVVATTLLILLVVILAVIIFLWARSFFPELIEKKGMPIEESCKVISLGIDYSNANGVISLTNKGDTPIYGIDVSKKTFGSVELIGSFAGQAYMIRTGERKEIGIDNSGLAAGDELIISPVLLGEDSTSGERSAVSCGSDYGQSISIE
jgi:flagellin-like protein